MSELLAAEDVQGCGDEKCLPYDWVSRYAQHIWSYMSMDEDIRY